MSPKIELYDLLVTLPATLHDALLAIDKNGFGVVFLVDHERKLKGVLTDGDIRRLLLRGDLLSDLIAIGSNNFNSSPKFINSYYTPAAIWSLFGAGYKLLPIVDDANVVIDYSCQSHIRRFSISEPSIGGQEIANVHDCMVSGWISSHGKYIAEFENKFCQYLGGGFGIAVSNCTVALQLALKTFDIGLGDEVIVPDLTFAATINAVIHSGANPVLVDIDPSTWALDAIEVEKKINSKTKAIIVVHLYGQPARIDDLKKIADKYNLFLIEDCAESLGATYNQKLLSPKGDCACYSFFANKLITTGEGGMLVFDDINFFNRARVLRDHGMSQSTRYWHEVAGFNFRMTNMQAAVGVAQLSRIEEFLAKRKLIFELYNSIFINHREFNLLPRNDWSTNSCWLYTLFLADDDTNLRNALIEKIGQLGIDARVGFYPLHEMPPYSKFGRGDYPYSTQLSRGIISLPTSLSLVEEDIRYIASTVINEFRSLKERNSNE